MGESRAQHLPVAVYALVCAACAGSFHLLRASIAREHRHDASLHRLHRKVARKNSIALTFTLLGAVLAWVYVPLALVFVSLPAVMYFVPTRLSPDITDHLL